MNKLRVCLVCHFSNSKVREHLPLGKRKMYSFIRKLAGLPTKSVGYVDVAGWDTYMIELLRKRNDIVIGGAGFGFERDEQGNRFPFPQVGGEIIGDNVEVRSNTCIDRGSLSDTIIGDHTKINNLCHIAHNNHIGRIVVIAGCVNVSGSNVIDDDVWIAPNSSIRGFVHLGEGCMVGMGAVVVKNIPPHEVWVGNPARKIEEKSSNS